MKSMNHLPLSSGDGNKLWQFISNILWYFELSNNCPTNYRQRIASWVLDKSLLACPQITQLDADVSVSIGR